MTHHIKRYVYPFTAIVGQENMKLALLLNAINPKIGGVLIRGQKGTGKSTAVRALADLLPEIDVVDGCPFNCNPYNPREMCDSCFSKFESGDKLPVKKRKVKLVLLPLNATVDRVVGALDISKALKEGIKALEPGLLAEVHQGILYIDEVNLLDDYIADILLDVAASGVNVVEREGISVSHPSNFILIGTMNPEEGELRPQLLDRFGLQVTVEELKDPKQRAEIVKRVDAFDRDPEGFIESFREKQNELREKIIRARELLPKVKISDDMLSVIISLCLKIGVSSHRAEITLTRTAKTLAAFNGRTYIIDDDIKTAAILALPHRMRKLPFEVPKLDHDTLETVLQEAKNELITVEEHREKSELDANTTEQANDEINVKKVRKSNLNEKRVFGIRDVPDIKLSLNEGFSSINKVGKRVKTITEDKRGVYFTSRIPKNGQFHDIAVDATLRVAALRLVNNNSQTQLLQIKEEDLREKVRHSKTSALVIFLVDASGSMAAMKRMEIAKGAMLSLLKDSYINRDSVAFIAFFGEQAKILVPPTRNLEKANIALRKLPTGGRTPLSSGLATAYRIIKNEVVLKRKSVIPYLVLITDGKANVPLNQHLSIQEEITFYSRKIKSLGTRVLVIDTRPTIEELLRLPNYINEIVKNTDAEYIKCDKLDKEKLSRIIKIYKSQ
ncbi:MAG: magnesium chelatase subunit D family protein [Candidatus Asgardarchaeia archaeon]